MLNRKNIISVLLILAVVAVFYFWATRTEHGNPAQWIKNHGAVASRHEDINKFCVDCHTKKLKQTKDNFCNECHKRSNIKLIK